MTFFVWTCLNFVRLFWGSGDSSVVQYLSRDRKAAGSNPDRSGGRIFFSRVKFLC